MALSHESLQLHPLSGVRYGKDASYFQAENMCIRSGIAITPEQADLYRDIRKNSMNGDSLKSDQKLMVEVLEQTGGPAEIFKLSYPNIFPPEAVKES